MKYKLELAPELIPVLEQYKNESVVLEGKEMKDIFRASLQVMAKKAMVESSSVVDVENKYFINSENQQIQLRVFTPKNSSIPMPCLYWMHGGGTMSGLPEQEDSMLYEMALEIGCVIVSVAYRLAPENSYPAPINDCYEGLEFVASNDTLFNIDKNKIAIGGGSAGGLLSTSCALLARERKGPQLIHQSLSYPMLDNRGITNSSREIIDIGVWDREANLYGWNCYLANTEKENYPLAVPALVDDLSDLPSAFIAVGTMDCLRDESIEYAQKLSAAGVVTELHIYPGMVHVFDSLVPDSNMAKDFKAARISALKRAFAT